MSDLPGADHDTSRWSVCAAAVVPGQPVAGPDGQAAERNHPEVLHASDAGMILGNPGTGCSTAVEYTPHERSRGFKSRLVLGFFSSLFYQKCVLNQVPRGGGSCYKNTGHAQLCSLRQNKLNKHSLGKKRVTCKPGIMPPLAAPDCSGV